MTKKLFGLGKGLNSLIPNTEANLGSKADSKEKVFYVEVQKIRSNPDQPRVDFDEESLKELASSIRKYGVLQPLLVTKKEEESTRGLNVYYELIAGERRLRAAQKVGLPQVPVVIRDEAPNSKSERLELALIENIQRQDLNPLEEAEAFERLQKEFGFSPEEIGTQVSKSREAVANTIRLLKLPVYIKDSLRSGKISSAHARALLSFSDQAKQKEVHDQIIMGGFSSKDVEREAAKTKVGKGTPSQDNRFLGLQKNLSEKLQTAVVIKNGTRGGAIHIKFATLEELNEIAKSIID